MQYKKRFGDRPDGRKLRSLTPMTLVTPYIMKTRVTAANMIRDSIDVEPMEQYIREKRSQGMKNFGVMHVLIAAYVRACSQMPYINRFVSGQRVFSREKVIINMVIKKDMNRESPDTCMKYIFEPDATAEEVYTQIQNAIEAYRSREDESAFDKLAGALNYIPGLVLKFLVWFLNLLDYFGLLPMFLINLSPFHGSMFITSMGSLGIPPIFHHLYDFGNVPVFLAFGAKRRAYEADKDGNVITKRYLDYTYVLDERICDGYCYASALKLMRSLYKNPWQLDQRPDQVVQDVY